MNFRQLFSRIRQAKGRRRHSNRFIPRLELLEARVLFAGITVTWAPPANTDGRGKLISKNIHTTCNEAAGAVGALVAVTFFNRLKENQKTKGALRQFDF